MSKKAPASRYRAMHRMRARGATDVEIATKFGLSKQRVGQILGPKSERRYAGFEVPDDDDTPRSAIA
jgi:hypothetical protein